MTHSTDWAGVFASRHADFTRIAWKAIRKIHGKPSNASDEAIADVMFYTWKYFSNEIEKGRASLVRLNQCLYFAIRKVRSGVMSRNGSKSRDIHSQAEKGHCHVEAIGSHANFLFDPRASIPDLVATKLDFTTFLDSLDISDRWKISEYVEGYTTTEVAEDFHVTAGAISQNRRAMADRYRAFLEA